MVGSCTRICMYVCAHVRALFFLSFFYLYKHIRILLTFPTHRLFILFSSFWCARGKSRRDYAYVREMRAVGPSLVFAATASLCAHVYGRTWEAMKLTGLHGKKMVWDQRLVWEMYKTVHKRPTFGMYVLKKKWLKWLLYKMLFRGWTSISLARGSSTLISSDVLCVNDQCMLWNLLNIK